MHNLKRFSCALPNSRRLFFLLLSICLLITIDGCSSCHQSNPQYSNLNANTSANANANTINNASPGPTEKVAANSNVNESTNSREIEAKSFSREKFERHKEEYEKLARRSGRTIGDGPNDALIWLEVYSAMLRENELRGSSIDVDVDRAVVQLSGKITNARQRAIAINIAQQTRGVEKVNDQLVDVIAPINADEFDIDYAVQTMKDGAAITEVPVSMYMGETRPVVLVLSPSINNAKNVEEGIKQEVNKRAAQTADRRIASTTRIETEKAQFSSYMEAKLSGQGFEVKNVTPERQPVTNSQTTQWRWEVKATGSGEQYLYLVMNAIFEDGKGEKTRAVNTFSKLVTVKVSWPAYFSSFISGNWQWIIVTLLFPLVGWIAAQIAKRKRETKAN